MGSGAGNDAGLGCKGAGCGNGVGMGGKVGMGKEVGMDNWCCCTGTGQGGATNLESGGGDGDCTEEKDG